MGVSGIGIFTATWPTKVDILAIYEWAVPLTYKYDSEKGHNAVQVAQHHSKLEPLSRSDTMRTGQTRISNLLHLPISTFDCDQASSACMRRWVDPSATSGEGPGDNKVRRKVVSWQSLS